LIEDKLTFINVKDDFLRMGGDRPSLGTLYLATQLNANGFNSDILDLNHFPEDKLIKQLTSNPSKVYGVSMTTPQYKEGNRIARLIKQYSPESKIICGGAHPTAVNGNMPDIWDHVITGEAEETIVKLIYDGFPNQKIIPGDDRDSKGKSLDHILIPDRSLVPMSEYSLTINGKKASTLMTSRGCPYSCNFCSEPILNNKYRKTSPERVIEEMKYLKYNFGTEALIIYDDVYVLDKERTKKIARLMIDNNLNLQYRATTRARDLIKDTDLLPLLKDSGCIELCLGTESGDNQVLKINDKGMNIETNLEAIKKIKNHGIKAFSYMITGLPGFSRESELKSLKFLKDSGVDEAGWYMLAPFPSTPIWLNRKEWGMRIFEDDIIADEWDITQAKADNKNVKCYFDYPHMNREEIKNLWLEMLGEWKSHTQKLNKGSIQDKK
jgi:radical SAM superfamily enzyme YgiQ (UPF0313 family)